MKRPAGGRIVWLTNRRKEDTQIIVNLRRGRDGRTRVGASAPLLNGNRRRQAFDEVDVRLFHLIEELTGVGRQAFHIAALPFGIKSIESEGRFPGPAQSGDHDQFFSRNLDIEILEIVLAGTNDLDNLRRHSDDGCRTF